MRLLCLLLLLCAPLAAQARRTGAILGAELAFGAPLDRRAWFGDSEIILDALDADVTDEAAGARFGIRAGYQLTRWFGLELRGRWMEATLTGTFEGLPGLDHAISKTTIPLNLVPRVHWDGRAVGLSVGVGPGLYVIDVQEQGHLGAHASTQVAFGYIAEIALALHLTDRATLELGWSTDRFAVERTNALTRDGGVGDLVAFSAALSVILGD